MEEAKRKAAGEPTPHSQSIDFSKIRVGLKSLDDAVYNLGDLKRTNSYLADKKYVLDAIHKSNYAALRDISNFFYKTSGIYNRLCRYMAYMYRYDWFVTPYIYSDSVNTDKIVEIYHRVLNYLDNCYLKKFFGQVALKVLRNGCYYGYLIPMQNRMAVQELPPQYCRSRFTSGTGRPVVEFNMKFFKDSFADQTQRTKMLKLFPDEFGKAYLLYLQGKLAPDFQGDQSGWYMLDPDRVIKFNINGDDFPAFIAVIPALIDLDQAQGLDKKKMQQQLLKIIVQKMPMDKNGDLIFDMDQIKQLHNNAVMMLSKAIGVDILTTVADTEVADMSSTATTTAADDSMDRMRNAVYDQAGVSQLQFNSNSNIALNNSTLNDEASMYNLVQQFEQFINLLLEQFNKMPKKYMFKAQILSTTIYNYKDLAKLYKEQTQLGYSKLLPQIALGQSQSSVLANAYFENDILSLINVFIPPISSNTMSAETLQSATGDGKVGRPEKQDNEKSEKTIANRESM